jgi:hypothetical protein
MEENKDRDFSDKNQVFTALNRQIEREKLSRLLAFRFGCIFFFALCKPAIQNTGDNIGLPIIGQAISWLIFLMLLLTLLPLIGNGQPQEFDPKKFIQAEIPLYLLGLLQFIQIFNPKTNFISGFSSFVTYFLSPILVYLIVTRLIKNTHTLDIFLKVMYIFAVVNLLFGIYTSIFGEPSFLFSKAGDEIGSFLTEDGKLRVKALTGTEQTYYISVFIIISFAYFRDQFWFKTLSGLMIVQLIFYPAKNPLTYVVAATIYFMFMPKRYHWTHLLSYYLVMIAIFTYFITVTVLQGVRELDSWLGQTLFASDTVVSRYWRWVVNLDAVFKNPFGYGCGTATKLILSPNLISEVNAISTDPFESIGVLLPDGTKIEEPHSEYIRLAVEGSILSPLLLISMISNALSTLKKRIVYDNHLFDKLLASFIFGFTFISFFNNHIFGAEEKYIFWLMMGLTFNRYDILESFATMPTEENQS